MKKLPCLIIVISLLMAACATVSPPSSASTSESTNTVLPANTITFTPTPTLALPVSIGTPMPVSSEVISNENASQLEEILYLEPDDNFVLNMYAWDKYYVEDTTHGVYLLSKDLKILNKFPAAELFCLSSKQDLQKKQRIVLSSSNQIAIAMYDKIQIYSLNGEMLNEIHLKTDLGNSTWLDYSCGLDRYYRYSPDFNLVAVGELSSDFNDKLPLQIYDVKTGEMIAELEGGIPRIFSPDGRYLVVQNDILYDSKFTVYQTSDWKKTYSFPAFALPEYPIAVSPNGKYLVSLAGDKLYDLENGNIVNLPEVECDFFSDLCSFDNYYFSKDGTRLAIINYGDAQHYYIEGENSKLYVEPKKLIIWDLELQKQLDKFEGNAPTPQNDWIKAIPEYQLTWWSPQLYEAKAKYSFSEDNSLIGIQLAGTSFNNDNYLPFFEYCDDVHEGKQQVLCQLMPQFNDWAKSSEDYLFSKRVHSQKENRYVTCSVDKPFWLNCATFETLFGLAGTMSTFSSYDGYEYVSAPFEICKIKFDGPEICNALPAGEYPYLNANGEAYTLSLESKTELSIKALEKNSSGKTTLITFGGSGSPQYFDVFVAPDETFTFLDPVSNEVVVANSDGKILHQKRYGESYLKFVVSPGGKYFAAYITPFGQSSTYGGVFNWTTNESILKIPLGGLDAFSFSEDEKIFVYIERETQADKPWEEIGRIKFYDLETREIVNEISTLFMHNGVSAMEFLPDKNLLVLGLNDGTLRILDTVTGSEIYSRPIQNGEFEDIQVSPDGKLLLTIGAWDGSASIWGVHP